MFRIRLKKLREEKGMSQREFATDFGVSPATVGMWESGAREPRTLEQLQRLADYFETTVDYLLGRTDDPYDYENDPNQFLDDIPLEHLQYYQEAGLSEKEIIKRHLAYQEAVATEALNEKRPALKGERKPDVEDLKLALFGGDGEVTEEMWEEALFAAEMIKARYKRKKAQDE